VSLAAKKKQVLLNRGPGFDDTNQGLQNRKGSIIGGLKNHVFNAALSYSPQCLSPGVWRKAGTLRIHKTRGSCGGLAENKKGSVCFAKYFVRFVVKKIRFFKCEIASLAYTHSQ